MRIAVQMGESCGRFCDDGGPPRTPESRKLRGMIETWDLLRNPLQTDETHGRFCDDVLAGLHVRIEDG